MQKLCTSSWVCQYSSTAKETQPQDIWDQGQAVAKHWQMSTEQPITEIYTRKQSTGSSKNQVHNQKRRTEDNRHCHKMADNTIKNIPHKERFFKNVTVHGWILLPEYCTNSTIFFFYCITICQCNKTIVMWKIHSLWKFLRCLCFIRKNEMEESRG